MSRIVYVNGQFLPEEEATISIFDRGFIFSDGVYEVTSVIEGGLIDNDGHLARLQRSLSELSMTMPCDADELTRIQKELVKRNGLTEGVIYMQVTRGASDRDFPFPDNSVKPTLIMFTQVKTLIDAPQAKNGIKVITCEDIRWRRRDIKTVGLLAPVLAKQAAKEAGCQDAWLVENGFVTEGSSNNAYIVTKDDVIITRQLSNDILHGITRSTVLKLVEENGMQLVERAFKTCEIKDAKEAFVTSASTFVYPVIEVDGVKVGDGTVGPVAKRLRELYIDYAKNNLS